MKKRKKRKRSDRARGRGRDRLPRGQRCRQLGTCAAGLDVALSASLSRPAAQEAGRGRRERARELCASEGSRTALFLLHRRW